MVKAMIGEKRDAVGIACIPTQADQIRRMY